MQLQWTQGGAPIARSIKNDALLRDVDLTDTDRTFIRYIELIPPKAKLELTRRRSVDHDVVSVDWEAESRTSGTSRGKFAFFDIAPWIVGRLTNSIDADSREAV